jgi:ribosomal protein S18 acetylase RimI-like enzyme
VIRNFAAADADRVNAVALAAFAQFRGIYGDWDRLMAGVGATAALAKDAELIVAEDESGRIAGSVAYDGPDAPRAEFFDPKWAVIRMLVVDPAARGKGIGRALTEECIRRARRDGASVIALHTSPKMEVALAMYLRMGFRLERALEDRYGVPYNLYVLDLTSEGARG